jgi:hypothetical protein
LWLSPKQRPFSQLLWLFASLEIITGLYAFHLFLVFRPASGAQPFSSTDYNKGGRANVADAGGEVTV